MAWKECRIMDERIKFVARLLEGEKMSLVCREFGITRRTDYKIYDRYKEQGLEGLNDRSRRPYRHANQLPYQVERAILGIKKEYPSWGAPKIREKLSRMFADIQAPATSTVHAVLDRHNLVKRRKHRRYKPQGTTLSSPTKPNQLWCCNYKGEFMLGNKQYCYPLTITDAHTRYLLACEAQESAREAGAFAVFEHERMHRTLKQETAKPPAFNLLQQQAKFDAFIDVYNHHRPHQGIAQHYPAELYTPSTALYRGLPDVDYPFADKTVTVTHCGRICLGKKKINVSTVLGGQHVGITQTDDDTWLVSFMKYDLGYFDLNTCRLEPIDNPFNHKLYTMSSV